MRPIGIDLFSGAGGMSLGFEQAGFDIKASVEIDPVHSATHKFNFPNCKTICSSVVDIKGKALLKAANITKDVDVIFGGAPCQGFSMIGYRVLEDPRNSLVFHFLRLVKEIKPKSFVFENVKGLTIGKHSELLNAFIEEVEKAGYLVIKPYRVLNAMDFGVPQSRERLFLIGVRKEFDLPKYPLPNCINAKSKYESDSLFNLPKGPTVWDAIGDLPNADDFDELLNSDSVKTKLKKPSKYASILRGEISDPDDFSIPRIWNHTYLTSSTRTIHTAESISRFLETPHGKVEKKSRLLKLDPNGVCNTLRAGTDSARGAHTSPRPLHPTYGRVLTVREAARLHSYPDWFRFHVTKWHGFRQIGNSVPPLLAREVANVLIEALNIKRVRTSKPIELKDEDLLKMNMTDASEFFRVDRLVIAQRTRIPKKLKSAEANT